MLLEDAEKQGQENFIADLKKIDTAGQRLLALSNNIVKHSKIQYGKLDTNIEVLTSSSGTSSMIKDLVITNSPLAEDTASTKASEQGSLLVVDDNEMNRDVLVRHLENQSHTVAQAQNGRQALEMIRKDRFDLVLLDVMMPQMNGYQVLTHMKSDISWKNIPVIMISALGEMASVVQCIEMGAEDYLPKPFNPVLLKARINACLEKKRLRDQEIEYQLRLKEMNKALEVRNRFIRATFGRYLSDEIVESILEKPEGLKLGGEKREVTILMADLRGFTSICERLPPENIVGIINNYLETMTDIISQYKGTIIEFMGDAILVIFGAPIQRDNDAKRAVACAIEMQLAMNGVSQRNRQEGHSEVVMGIGINTGRAVVGNIGSEKRTKYGIVGRAVNLASRIETFTLGGQILVSESTAKACSPFLRVDNQKEVMLKGFKKPTKIYEVGGIKGDFNLFLPGKGEIQFVELRQPLPVRFTILADKHVNKNAYNGKMVRLFANSAEIQANIAPNLYSNLKLRLFDNEGNEIADNLYAKVTENLSDSHPFFRVNFTSIPSEAEFYFNTVLFSNTKS
jgi:adenylate cyclase